MVMRRLLLALVLAAGLAPVAAFGQAPPPVPALPDTERRTRMVLVNQTGPFSINFAIFGDGTDFGNWVEVYLNGTLVSPLTYTVTSPTGLLSLIPRPITDAKITFLSSTSATVDIVGARRPRRTAQFGTTVAPRDLNQAVTDLVAMERESWDFRHSRAVYGPPGETINQLPGAVARANSVFGWDQNGQPIATTSPPNANTPLVFGPRGLPGLFSSAAFPARQDVFPIAVYGSGIGHVIPSKTPKQLAYDTAVSLVNATEHCVDAVNGNDANTGLAPACFQTLTKGIRTDTASIVDIYPGTYAPLDFLLADAGATVLKYVRATRGPVFIQVVGPDITTAATGHTGWVLDSGTVYRTTLTLAGLQAPQLILRNDVMDVWGFPSRMPYFGSIALLQAAGNGWYFDPATANLYIAFLGLNVNTNRSRFNALYVDTNGNARFGQIGNAAIIFDGDFTFNGVQLYTLNNSTSVPNLYLQGGVKIRYAISNGISANGGLTYASGVRVHASQSDGINCRPPIGDPNNTQGFCIEHDVISTANGDTDTYGIALSGNKQGSSAEPCSNMIRMGGLYAGNWGQGIADVGGSGCTSYSWIIGTTTQTQTSTPTTGIGIYTGRFAWCDTCEVAGEAFSLTSDVGAVVKYTNFQGHGVAPNATNGGTLAIYTPASP